MANRLNLRLILASLAGLLLMASCSTTKYVPAGHYLLDKVKIEIKGDSTEKKPQNITSADLQNYLRQQPNYKVLGSLKMQLLTYSLAGRDTTSRWNNWLRKVGQAPVIYDSLLTAASARQLRLAMVNSGYMDATVDVTTKLRPRKKKAEIIYTVTPHEPWRVRSISYQVPDTAIKKIIRLDSIFSPVKPGVPFNRDRLEDLRVSISEHMRRRGYYAFTKDYITFVADTTENSRAVDLTLVLHAPPAIIDGKVKEDSTARHRVHNIRNVIFLTDYAPGKSVSSLLKNAVSKKERNGYITVYGADRYIKPSVLIEKCFITPGHRYNSAMVERTYEYMAQLGILRSINIELQPVAATDSTVTMDAYVLLSRNKKQSISFEVEGTNSEGDLGFGLGLTYQHRNLAHESQLLTAKIKTSYESISGTKNDLSKYINNRYTEQSAEVGLTFPRFIFPFITKRYKHNVKASSMLSLAFNYQERPEYTRVISGAGWGYKWNNRFNTKRISWDLVDVSYVRIPKRSEEFINRLQEINNPLVRSSYDDHFIMRTGIQFQRTNRWGFFGLGTSTNMPRQPYIYNIRASAEFAGNILYAISKLSGQKKVNDVYEVFGTQYAQYVKGEINYNGLRNLSPRQSVAFRAGLGIGLPYGNSEVMPFEKRFYAGGANGVRGWAVRQLGPGSYAGSDSKTDFMTQCGDISLILSAEYRAKLFWLLEGAFFVDAGNIWTIRNYPDQPGGMFYFDKFVEQLALSYGLGLRLDFNYFIFRADAGIPAHNPAKGATKWPMFRAESFKNMNLHFAVGYPF